MKWLLFFFYRFEDVGLGIYKDVGWYFFYGRDLMDDVIVVV